MRTTLRMGGPHLFNPISKGRLQRKLDTAKIHNNNANSECPKVNNFYQKLRLPLNHFN